VRYCRGFGRLDRQDLPLDDLRDLALEVSGVAQFAPQYPSEKFPAWRVRIKIIIDERRKFLPILNSLRLGATILS